MSSAAHDEVAAAAAAPAFTAAFTAASFITTATAATATTSELLVRLQPQPQPQRHRIRQRSLRQSILPFRSHYRVVRSTNELAAATATASLSSSGGVSSATSTSTPSIPRPLPQWRLATGWAVPQCQYCGGRRSASGRIHNLFATAQSSSDPASTSAASTSAAGISSRIQIIHSHLAQHRRWKQPHEHHLHQQQ